MQCQACGARAPTKNVSFSQNIGVVLMRFHKSISGNLCRACIDSNFWSMTLTTLFLGWWGVISFFFTLFILPMNIITYLGALSLPRSGDGMPGGGGYGGPPGGYGGPPGGGYGR